MEGDKRRTLTGTKYPNVHCRCWHDGRLWNSFEGTGWTSDRRPCPCHCPRRRTRDVKPRNNSRHSRPKKSFNYRPCRRIWSRPWLVDTTVPSARQDSRFDGVDPVALTSTLDLLFAVSRRPLADFLFIQMKILSKKLVLSIQITFLLSMILTQWSSTPTYRSTRCKPINNT